ncbi:HAD family phosphatase [soil metagenome]
MNINKPDIDTIIFDLGGVLIDWNPEYVYCQLIADVKERKHFFDNICTHEWNEEQDAGRSLQEATDLLIAQFPDYTELIQAYYGRWEEMLKGSITETVDILNEIKNSSYFRLYALTNWSHETFHVALERYDFLHWFEGIVVSGEEKTRKPFPEIYQTLLERYKVNPENALFIDDNFRNIEGAQAVGIQTIHFQSPAQLRQELKKLLIL